MSYGRNFGMRAFTGIIRDGRNRVPSDAAMYIGAPVCVDSTTPGYLVAATADQAPDQTCGVVVYEHIQYKGVDAALTTYADYPFNQAPAGQYAQMVHGIGTKVWFRNTDAKTLYDGRVQAAGGLLADSVDTDTLTPGDQLGPDGSGKFKVVTSNAWFTVESVNSTTGVVDARFEF